MNLSEFQNKGKILMLAIDHRGSFKKLLNPNDPDSVDSKKAIKTKAEIIDALYSQFSGLLVDDEYGLPAYTELCDNKSKPYLLPIEESGYAEENGQRITTLKYNVTDLIDMGALGVKLLVYFNPHLDSCGKQLKTAKMVMDQCQQAKMPFFLEIVTYANGTSNNLVVDSVKKFVECGVIPTVFKLEYPGTPEACAHIHKLVGDTPWILLTRGADFKEFCNQLKVAVKHGCVGFLAGRSLWQEYPGMTNEKQKEEFLKITLPSRFERIVDIVFKKI